MSEKESFGVIASVLLIDLNSIKDINVSAFHHIIYKGLSTVSFSLLLLSWPKI